jgi:hypothetical protein
VAVGGVVEVGVSVMVGEGPGVFGTIVRGLLVIVGAYVTVGGRVGGTLLVFSAITAAVSSRYATLVRCARAVSSRASVSKRPEIGPQPAIRSRPSRVNRSREVVLYFTVV